MTRTPLRIVPPDEPATPPVPRAFICSTLQCVLNDLEAGRGNPRALAMQLRAIAGEVEKLSFTVTDR